MIQFFANSLEQLDMAVDHLAVGDANNARIALMLIDNVVEINLHRYAEDCKRNNDLWGKIGEEKYNAKIVNNATGRNFDAKVKLAKVNDFMNDQEANTIMICHQFRNETYHVGLQHEPVLHQLALFYLQVTCDVLIKYPSIGWYWSSNDKIPHRAQKYLSHDSPLGADKYFEDAWGQLKRVAANMPNDLISSLYVHLNEVINDVEHNLNFLVEDNPQKTTRKKQIISTQVWNIAFKDETKKFAEEQGCKADTIFDYINWLIKNYKCSILNDPINRWRKRAEGVEREKCLHTALKKYQDFMGQTEIFREQINESAFQLDSYIQEQIDIARGK